MHHEYTSVIVYISFLYPLFFDAVLGQNVLLQISADLIQWLLEENKELKI